MHLAVEIVEIGLKERCPCEACERPVGVWGQLGACRICHRRVCLRCESWLEPFGHICEGCLEHELETA